MAKDSGGSFITGFLVPGRFREVREAERSISSSFRQKHSEGLRAMTKKPKKLTTINATTINM